MNTITASCPKCFTEYQLQPDQLQVADGKVRCGECLTVFHAKDQSPVARSSFAKNPDEEFLNAMIEKELKSYSDTAAFPEPDDSESVLEDESWVQNLLEEDESWAEKLLEEEADKETQNKPQLSAEEDPFAAELADLSFSVELSDEEEDLIASLSEKGNLRDRIQTEPLELSLVRRRSAWIKAASIFALLVLLLALCVQIFYFQFNELAKKAPWRSLYASVCQFAACELPDIYSSDSIQATQLTVKTVAEKKGVLLVDVVLLNQAKQAQPFPHFELFFTNRNNRIVAARSFAPAEYLLGELKGLELMNAKQPVRVSLEIADPGVDASGYWMQLRYSE